MAQGFRQKHGVYHLDTYAPFARITTISLLLAIASSFNLVFHQMDVKIAFLYSDLKEDTYKRQHEGFIMKGQEQKLGKLIKSLYESK